MVLTLSKGVPLGTSAPDFSLRDAGTGTIYSLPRDKGEIGTMVMFICNHCPYVIHIREHLAALGKDYAGTGLAIFAINSNDFINYPEDSPEMMAQYASRYNYVFPYLLDESQDVARAWQATCTPDFFLYDAGLKLVYRGQLDSSRPGSRDPVTGQDLRSAMDALLRGKPVSQDQKPSMGCNIKWKR